MSVSAVRYLSAGADDTALALKVYLGKFTEAFRTNIFLWGRDNNGVMVEQVDFGKSFQFLMDGDTPAPEDYTPGNELVGQAMATEEGVISTDRHIVAHKWIPRDQMKWGHFQVLEKQAKKNAYTIAREMDRRQFITACLAARAAAATKDGLNIHNGGNRVTRSGGSLAAAYPLSATGAANFRADLRRLGRLMDEDNLPPNSRDVYVLPYIREVLLYDATNQVFSSDFQDSNKVQERTIMKLEGFNLRGFPNAITNNGPFPDANITSGPAKYQADFSVGASNGTPACLALCSGIEGQAAIGTVVFESVQSIVQYYPEKLSWFVCSHILCGTGQMHPWCAGSTEVIT